MARDDEKLRQAAKAWEDYGRQRAQLYGDRLPLDNRSFTETAWNNFDPQAVAEMLLDKRDSFYGHKEILLAGYTTWVLAPSNARLRQAAMVVAALQQMAKAEKLSTANFTQVGMVADFLARYQTLGPEFFEQLYYPIGGIKAFARAPSRGSLKASIEKHSEGLPYAVQVARIYHHHVLYLLPLKFRRPSLETASALISELDIKELRNPTLAKTSIKVHWASHKATIALAYAASTLATDEQISFLDLMLERRVTYAKHGTLLPVWLGRAQWISEHVLEECYETATARQNLEGLPKVASLEAPPPGFSEDRAENIKRRFTSSG